LALLVTVGLVLRLAAAVPAPAPAVVPPWWDLEVRLSAEGSYRMSGGEVSTGGHYRFSVSWTGMMERDGADFRLFHNRCDLVQWEAEERSSAADRLVFLSTSDFADKPVFSLNFLLARDGLLVFDLAAQGFEVPVADAPDRFFLLLPSSAENGQTVEGVDYNSRVSKGSNRIALPADAILKGAIEKAFAWDWKHDDWRLDRSKTVSFAHRHGAKLILTVRPHHEAGLRPPGPAAQALGWKRS
jgi:hypothetical protein